MATTCSNVTPVDCASEQLPTSVMAMTTAETGLMNRKTAVSRTSHYYYYFLTPVLNSQGMKKITLCNTKTYKNQAGINLTTPPPSQNSYAVRWHCTAESEWRVAEMKS